MDERDALTERFEPHRARLRAVAYQTLGSPGEADDAVQEAWLRLSRADPGSIEPEPAASAADGADPEREALLADSIGPALLVILHTLAPAERLAFVLHESSPSLR
jgi:Sigma-70 region 2